jgi:hypothetical protein
VHRNQGGTSWQVKAVLFALSASAVGVVAGGALGLLGAAFPVAARLAIASVLGALALVIGMLEVGGRRLTPPQRSCETPQRWVHLGAVRWSLRNGVTLGFRRLDADRLLVMVLNPPRCVSCG